MAIAIVSLILFVIVAVQIVLWTDWPKSFAIAQIQNQLGARASIDSLHISWLGHTTLQGVTLTLPLAHAPVVRLDEVLVEHASLPVIAFTERVNRITVHGAEIDLREESPGRWNVQQLVPVTEEMTRSASVPDIPALIVENARLSIKRADGAHGRVEGVAFSGKKAGPLEYDFTAAAGQFIAVTGQFSLTRDLQHQLKLEIAGIPPGLEPLIGRLPIPVLAIVDWKGRTTENGIAGELLVRDALVQQKRASGHATLTTTPGRTLRIAPANLQIDTKHAGVGKVVLESGQIDVGEKIRIEQLHMKLEQGHVAVQGEFDPAAFAGHLSAAWQQIQQKGITTTGTAELHVGRELTGEISGNAVLKGSIETPSGNALGSMTIAGKGRSLEEFEGTVGSEPFSWHPVTGQPIAVPALAGHVSARGSRIVLDSLRPRDAQAGEFLATAEFNREVRKWWASLHTRELDVSQLRLPGLKLPLDVNLNVDGTFSRFDVRQFYLRQGKATLYVTGFYDAALPKPVQLDTWCWFSPKKESDEDASFEGFSAHGQLAGTLAPRALTGKGTIDARNLVIRDHVIGDVTLDLVAQISDWHAAFSTAEMKLLEGDWQMKGEWTAFSDRPPRATITWKNLSLPALGDVARVEGLEGTIDTGRAVFTAPSFRLRDWTMKALVHGTNLKVRGVVVEAMDIDSTLDHGSIVATPILRRGDGSVRARINATLATDQPLHLAADIDRWPAPTLGAQPWAADLRAAISGKVEASYLIAARELTARTDLNGTINRSDATVGAIDLSASLQNTRFTLEKLHLKTLNGTADATGSADLANLETTRVDLVFNHLKPAQVAWISPVLADVAGEYSGALRIAPATAQRPLGPVRIEFAFNPVNAGYKTVGIGDARIIAYAAYQSPDEWRVVTDEAEINLAGGKIKPFARFSRSPKILPTQLVTADLAAIQLSPLVRAYKDDGKEIVGEVTGQVRAFGSTRAIDALTAEADVRLTNSELGNFGPVAAMYNVLHLGGGAQPTGSGRVVLRMENGAITIPTAYYFNRGAYINAFGVVSDVQKFPYSPLDLTLFGSLRPLRDIDLPFFADADKLFSVIQAAGTTIHASGTVHDPKAEQVAFKELGQAVQGVLLGKIKEEKEP